MSMAMGRGRRPLTWGADQGLRQVDSREMATHINRRLRGPWRTRRSQLSLSGL